MLGWKFSGKHLKHPFGSYGLAYEDPTVTDTQQPGGSEAIWLGPTCNMQGTYKFLNLSTGRIIKLHKCDD